MKKNKFPNMKEEMLLSLRTKLENIIYEAHGSNPRHPFKDGHMPYHQHKRFSGIMHAVVNKITEYEDDMIICELETSFMETQEPVFETAVNWGNEAQSDRAQSYRIRQMCGMVNVALMMHSKKKGYGVRR